MIYKRHNLRYITCIVLLVGLTLSCKKTDTGKDPQPKEEVPTPTAISFFAIEKKFNPNVQSDILFEIKGDTIWGNLSKLQSTVVPSFTSSTSKITINSTPQISGTSVVDFRNTTTYSLYNNKGEKHDYVIKINWNDSLPHLSINTEGGIAITSKDNYQNATITIDGRNIYPNYSGNTQIKGRGNTTWAYPKKPYRLKLTTQSELLGLPADKDWVLLANYLDETHLLNSIALQLGKNFNVPFSNTGIPVEVTINGVYKGLYLFTEQIEVASNRVNIGNDGTLLELDTYYDEDYKFKSNNFQLPVMLKEPKLENASQLLPIKNQFQAMEDLIASPSFPNNNYIDFIDTASLVGYLMVFMITDNEEINHPKSIYMNKTASGKFVMGPVWDFDWAYGYEGPQKHFSHYNKFFWQGTQAKAGTKFFSKFLSDPKITALIKKRWATFSNTNNLQTFVDEWAYKIEGARNRDYAVWARGNVSYQTDISALKNWLSNRLSYLTTYINGWQ